MRGLMFISITLLLFLGPGGGSSGGAQEDFLSWTAKRCDEVIRKSGKGEGMASSIRNATLGAQATILGAVWVTDTTAKALARKIQLEERQDEKRALEIKRDLWSDDAYTLLVSSASIYSLGWISLDVVTPRSAATIFLQDKKKKEKFVRLKSLRQFPYSISNPAIAASLIMTFDRKTDNIETWITTLDQEIELEIALPNGGKTRIGFKVKDLPVASPAELWAIQ